MLVVRQELEKVEGVVMGGWRARLNLIGIQLIVVGVLCWFLGTAIWNAWEVFDFEVKEAFISMKDIWIRSSESNQRCWGLFVLLCLAVAGCAFVKVLFVGLVALAEAVKEMDDGHLLYSSLKLLTHIESPVFLKRATELANDDTTPGSIRRAAKKYINSVETVGQ